jgi:hypothetical protein
MRLGVVRRILKETLQGGEKPAWLEGLLSPLNQFMESVYLALNNGLNFQDNFSAKVVTQTFEHGVEREVNPQSRARITGIIVTDAQNAVVTGYGFTRKTNGKVGVTIKFEPSTDPVACTVVILLG